MSDHDFEDPIGHLNALEVAWLAADSTRQRCPHGCDVTTRMLPMTGTAWGLDETHEPTCPINEDSQPAAEAGPDGFPEDQ